MPSLAGGTVNADTALHYSGIWACVRLLAGDISTLPLVAYRKVGAARIPLDPQPQWIAEPDPVDPSITRIDHVAPIAVSLLLDGNAFIVATPSVLIPSRLEVLNPKRVEVRKPAGSPEYQLRNEYGALLPEIMSPNDILH